MVVVVQQVRPVERREVMLAALNPMALFGTALKFSYYRSLIDFPKTARQMHSCSAEIKTLHTF